MGVVPIFIIIPTYNERENIERLVKEILNLNKDFRIIAIDDNSPDGTGEILDRLAQEYSQFKVIHRPGKQGLGTAYLDGFRLALKEKADFIFEMDADFSHEPAYLPKMLEAIKDCDLVIGSRYIRRGGIENWNFRRRFLSRLANLYVKLITGLPLSDSTSGFKCFRREVLETINLNKINSEGYAFQIEMNYLVWSKGYRIKELPIVFSERRLGKSKLSRKIIWEAVWLVWKLRFRLTFLFNSFSKLYIM